jgi:hypothetical protein
LEPDSFNLHGMPFRSFYKGTGSMRQKYQG